MKKGRCQVPSTGFEPMTRCSENHCSSSLSYEGIEGRPGVEPEPAGPHPAVLPLNYLPKKVGASCGRGLLWWPLNLPRRFRRLAPCVRLWPPLFTSGSKPGPERKRCGIAETTKEKGAGLCRHFSQPSPSRGLVRCVASWSCERRGHTGVAEASLSLGKYSMPSRNPAPPVGVEPTQT